MKVRSTGVVAVAMGAITLLGSGGLGSTMLSGQLVHQGRFVAAHHGEALPTKNSTAESGNWAGYVVVPAQPVTAVSASWTVPSAGDIPPGFAGTWTGIGGYKTSDLIQAGTSEASISTPFTGATYYAWYELLPAGNVAITGCNPDPNCTVNPGDKVSVKISALSTANSWSIAMTDAGHWTYSTTVNYQSSGSSAEWIHETPSLASALPLILPSGNASFGPSNMYSTGGWPSTIAQGNPVAVDLSLFGLGIFEEATTSPLGSDGQSFNVCGYAQSCTGP